MYSQTIFSCFSLYLAQWVYCMPVQWPLSFSDIVWDGRVSNWFALEDFDSATLSPYNQTHVHGYKNWSDIIKFPVVQRSLFDFEAGTKGLEVTVDDSSLFLSGGINLQYGFRRAELNPVPNNGTADHFVDGKRTIHWSVRADPNRLLNFTHEYQNVFMETNDYSAHKFTMKKGTPCNNMSTGTIPATKTLRIESTTNNGVNETTLFETNYTDDDWHNFAVELDFENDLVAGWYFRNYDNLQMAFPQTSNNNSGGGLYHFGIIKLPASGTGNGSIPFSGYQPLNIDEGQYYGGIFIEDTSIQAPTTSIQTSGYVF